MATKSAPIKTPWIPKSCPLNLDALVFLCSQAHDAWNMVQQELGAFERHPFHGHGDSIPSNASACNALLDSMEFAVCGSCGGGLPQFDPRCGTLPQRLMSVWCWIDKHIDPKDRKRMKFRSPPATAVRAPVVLGAPKPAQ